MLSFVERWRAEIVVCVVLPISFVRWLVERCVRRLSAPDPAAHAERVALVVDAVRDRNLRAPNELMRTDRSAHASHSVRNADKRGCRLIPVGSLRAILGVSYDDDDDDDGASPVLRVEPGVTVGEATDFLSSYRDRRQERRRLMLECCLEMEEATLGGLALSQGMTTHSHVCGLLSDTVTEYEIVTADGRLLTVTDADDDPHRDLFRALPMSHGTLGIVVSLKLRLAPSKPYVRLRYRPLRRRRDLATEYETILRSVDDDDDDAPFFVEAIMFSPETSVLMTGDLVDRPPASSDAVVNRAGLWYKPWFFRHVETMLSSSVAVEEYLPLRDYLMRHDRSMCTTMETVVPYGNRPWFRYLLGWLLPPRLDVLKASHTPETREASVRDQCYQDVCFPAAAFEDAARTVDDLFGVYPLLVYPCRLPRRRRRRRDGGMIRTNDGDDDDDDFVRRLNLGVYGVPPASTRSEDDGEPRRRRFPMVTRVRALEKWLRDNGGFQHTYCDSFATEDEFREMFDHALYDRVRTEYGAVGGFPTVYEKTRPEVDVFRWLREEEEEEEEHEAESKKNA